MPRPPSIRSKNGTMMDAAARCASDVLKEDIPSDDLGRQKYISLKTQIAKTQVCMNWSYDHMIMRSYDNKDPRQECPKHMIT